MKNNSISTAIKNKREEEQYLIEGCKAMASENIKITKEFEAIEDLNNWKWKTDN